MEEIILVEVIGVLFAWAIVGFAIWKWGPGLRKRSVRCPEIRVHAQVMADQREEEFGCVRVVDLKTCSLIPSAIPECDKRCIARL